MTTPYKSDETHLENDFKNKLLAQGLLSKVTVHAGAPKGNRKPINVNGEPLSRSIIEARR